MFKKLICLALLIGASSPLQAQEVGPGQQAELQALYASLQIVNAQVIGGVNQQAGANVLIRYEIRNASGRALSVPLILFGEQFFRTAGARQHWIQRLGLDWKIPAIAKQTARRGTQYASGGSIIVGPTQWLPGQSLLFTAQVPTLGYPVGAYNYYVEFETLDKRVIQSQPLRFHLQ